MVEIIIHNGEILQDGKPVPNQGGLAIPPQQEKTIQDTNPDTICQLMAHTISIGVETKLTPMEIVNNLLTLKSENGHKIVWTRFDILQLFKLWSIKLEGKVKL